MAIGLLRASACRRSSEGKGKRTVEKSSRHDTSRPGSSRPGPSHPTAAPEQREINLRLKQEIERAGGADVWVKHFPASIAAGSANGAGPAEAQSVASIEVLATPGTFGSALSAFKQAAAERSVGASIHEENSPGGLRVVNIQVALNGQAIGNWRLREVPQLLRAAFVIDDLGQNLGAAGQLLKLSYPIAFSILPNLPHSKQTAEEVHRAGHEVMLHLPMEPGNRAPLISGDGVIRVGMSDAEVARILEADLASVNYVRGVNNHQGSRATADPRLMLALMRILAQHRLFFVDSRTTTDTVAFDEARRAGVPTFFRSVFLDDEANTSYVLGQLARFHRVVKSQGAALAIGHPHPSTIAALEQYLPQLERDDIRVVPVSELVRLPETTRLRPPPRLLRSVNDAGQ